MARHIFNFYRWVGAGLIALVLCSAAFAGSLLPNGRQQFIDGNGKPYAGGSVYFYIPGTTVPKNTYQDSSSLVLNTNPVVLDANGYATIYGTGSYRQILKDSLGNTIWDQLTSDTASSQISWSGNAAGTANAIAVSAPNFSSQGGQIITFRATSTNTGATTINVNGSGPISILRDLGGGLGSIALAGGEISSGAMISLTYDAFVGAFHLSSIPVPSGPLTTIAAATTTNLGGAQSPIVQVTGSGVTIGSFGTLATLYAPVVQLTFAGSNTITYNATSLITPSGQSISTAPGDSATLVYLGSGNWRIVSYSTSYSTPNIGSVSGLTIANNSGTPNTKIDIAATSAILEGTLSGLKISSASVTIDATTVGANGLDAGALAANTWYYSYLISDGTTTAGLLSASATAPTLPTGYTFKLRVGAIQTDATPVFYRLKQKGREAQYAITAATNTAAPWTVGLGSTAGVWTAKTVVGNGFPVPPTATMVHAFGTLGSPGLTVKVAPNLNYAASKYTPIYLHKAGASSDDVTVSAWIVLESTSIGYNSDDANGATGVFAWKDAINAN